MARKLKPGDVVGGFTIVEERSVGALALSYQATAPDGAAVFLKQFKSPTPLVPWYADYVAYHDALRERIIGTPLRDVVVGIHSFFEATLPPRGRSTAFFQAFTLVEPGCDLSVLLARPAHWLRRGAEWTRRRALARALLHAVDQLHQYNIVHGDLKPQNVMHLGEPAATGAPELRLIDMDFAVMLDHDVPWQGEGAGNVGTPGYFSPEHLRGEPPGAHSDVFTLGLMLHELLGAGNPLADLDDKTYRARALGHDVPFLAPRGPLGAAQDAVVRSVHRMLSPNPRLRPTVAEVLGHLDSASPTSRASAPARDGAVRPARPVKPRTRVLRRPPAPVGPTLRLRFDSLVLPFNIDSRLNQRVVRRIGEDLRFWDRTHQLSLRRRDDGWYVVPNLAAPNETLINGKAVRGPTLLRAGDLLAIGREARGIVKSPATVELEARP